MNKVRTINYLISAILLLMLVACSSTTNESKAAGVSKNNHFLAQIAYDNKIYSIEGNLTPNEKIQQHVGKVEKIVERITENGQGRIISSKIRLETGSEIYTIKAADKDTVIAVKIHNKYYTTIFSEKLD